MKDNQSVRDDVRMFYAARALNSSSCCGDKDYNGTRQYHPSTLGDLPEDVTQFSLGCGDPITLASLAVGETVLDLGSGGGLDCFLAARRVGSTGKVIGVDMTPEMIEKANGQANRLGLGNVEFRLGTMEDLPVATDSVDVVLSNCVINLSPDKPAVLREAWRVLKPGGRLAISDIVSKGTLPEEVKKDVLLWASCAAEALRADEYVRLLEGAGFVDVSVVAKDEAGFPLSGIPEGTLFSAHITGVKR